jgi:hypothetical protein
VDECKLLVRTLRGGRQTTKLARHFIVTGLSPRFSTDMGSYDVASSVYQAHHLPTTSSKRT